MGTPGDQPKRATPPPARGKSSKNLSRRRFIGGAAVAAIGIGGGVAFLRRDDDQTSGASSTANAGAKRTAVVAAGAPTTSFDPDSSEAAKSVAVWGLAYDSLFDISTPAELDASQGGEMDRGYETLPGLLAESWDMESDGSRFTFTLREDVTSNFGNTLDADDVVWSLQRALGIGALGAFFLGLGNITEPGQITAVDARTVAIEPASAPPPYFLKLLGGPWIAIYDSEEVSRHKTPDDEWATKWLASNTAGFGPFKAASTSPDGSVTVMERHPDYWREPEAGAVDEFMFRFVPEDGNRLQLLLSGDAQIAESLTALQLAEVEKSSNAKVAPIATAANVFLGMNCEAAPFDDALVRRAVARAIPYDDIIQTVYQGQAERWRTHIPPSFEAATDEFWDIDTDPAAARAELEGVKTPIRLSYVSGSSTEEQIAIPVRQALNAAGLDVTLEPLPRATAGKRRLDGELQFFIDPLDAPGVPSSFYALKQLFTTEPVQPILHYKNPEIDAAYDRGIAATDEAGKVAALGDAQRTLAQDMPMIPIAWTGTRLGAASDITGFKSITTNNMWLRDLRYES